MDLIKVPDLQADDFLQVLHRLRLDLSDYIVDARYYVSLLDLRDRLDVLQYLALKTSFSVYQDKRYC